MKPKPKEPVKLQTHYNGQGEAEVVPGFQLAAYLQRWRDQWYAERPHHELYTTNYISVPDWLSDQTGINPRRIRGLIRNEFPFVPFSQADLLLTVTNGTHLLVTGEIQVVPNPNWSLERWLAYQEEKGCI